MMKSVLLGTLAAFAIVGPAVAQGAPMAPSFSWTGFYIGANVGYAREDDGSNRGTTTFINGGLGGGPASAAALNQSLAGKTDGLSALIGGGQVGYNYQMGAIVLGVEADIQSGTNSRTTRDFNTPIAGFPDRLSGSASNNQRYDYLGTVRGRIGYLMTPSFLIFATAGLAYGEKVDTNQFAFNSVNVNIPATTATASRSSTRTGYTVGGGVEYALDQSWSVKGEALYYDMGSKSGTGSVLLTGAGGAPFVQSAIAASGKDRGIIGRVGLNYKFNIF